MAVYLPQHIHNGIEFIKAPMALVVEQGKCIDILPSENAPSDAIPISGTVCPGFVNAHCHLELSYLKLLIGKGIGLVGFLDMVRTSRNKFDESYIQQEIENAESEMIRNGIQAVGDICNTNHTIQQKKQGRLRYHNFIEILGIHPDKASTIKANAENLKEEFSQLGLSTYAPHASYSLSPELWDIFQQEWGSPTTIHNQESLAEDALITQGAGPFVEWFQRVIYPEYKPIPYGKSPLQMALEKMPNSQHLLLVHNTFTTPLDIDFAMQKIPNLYWVSCPKSNIYIEERLPSCYDYLTAQNANLCIGTDSLASNYSLDIYDELYTLQQRKPFSTEQLIRFATYNGAMALAMPDIARLEAGSNTKVLWLENVQPDQQLSQQSKKEWLVG